MVLTMNTMLNIAAPSQNTMMPFQANGPDLKNGSSTAGTNDSGAQMLTYPSQRGNSGFVRASERIANANEKYCAMNGGHGITRMIQLISLRS